MTNMESFKVLDKTIENEVKFDLSLPPLVSNKEEFYLSLIDFLVEELRKYANVTIYNEDILDQWKQKEDERKDKLSKSMLEQYNENK